MEDITLFHGSKGGIIGNIKPTSRDHCDFGCGFYMGESSDQAKGLVFTNDNPILYVAKLKLSEIPENRIVVLHGMDWICAVLANRQHIPEFADTKYAQDWRNYLNEFDVVIGPIADDKMAAAMKAFQNGTITTDGLLYCLQHVQYGNQYVCKTEEACNHIEIVSEWALSKQEIEAAKLYSNAKRNESNDVVRDATRLFRNKGLYIDQLIDVVNKKEPVTNTMIQNANNINDYGDIEDFDEGR